MSEKTIKEFRKLSHENPKVKNIFKIKTHKNNIKYVEIYLKVNYDQYSALLQSSGFLQDIIEYKIREII